MSGRWYFVEHQKFPERFRQCSNESWQYCDDVWHRVTTHCDACGVQQRCRMTLRRGSASAAFDDPAIDGSVVPIQPVEDVETESMPGEGKQDDEFSILGPQRT